jgi:hypothetical protein
MAANSPSLQHAPLINHLSFHWVGIFALTPHAKLFRIPLIRGCMDGDCGVIVWIGECDVVSRDALSHDAA